MSEKTVFISANTAWNLFSRKRLLLAMKEAGWTVVCLANPDSNADRFMSELGIEFISLPMKGDGTSLKDDIKLFFRFFGLYRKHKPYVALHINNKPNIYGSIAAAILRIPSASNITGLGVVAEKKGLTKAIVYTLYRLAFASRKTFVFFQNPDDRRFFLENRLVAPDRTHVLPGSGVNCDFFVPDAQTETQNNSKNIIFLFNGRLLITKGIRVFIEAAKQVRALYSEAQFTIIGEYIPSNPIFIPQDEFDAAVTSGVVRYYGSVQDVKQYVRDADCVVLPSWYREGVPRSLLEAAAMGKPVIACNSVGTKEPVQDGVNGWLVEPDNIASLADAMKRFIESGATARARMGNESRRIAETRFSDRIVISAYLERLDVFMKDKT
jgi:Glycosyltransferase